MTLTEFLLARIAEDEAECGGGDEPENWCDRATGVHYNPARVLAECEAKQRIVADHSDHNSPADPAVCDAHDGKYAIDDCPTLRALASVYADHPDYRDEWRP